VPHIALSLKQPWAALLAAGRKTIEVRKWSTLKRGTVLIHASRIPDPRPYAWSLVPAELREAAQLLGGLIGVGELTECRRYRTPLLFGADQARHLNDLDWYQSGLYGFVFTGLRPLPYVRVPGWMRFFEVPDEVMAQP
jgi:hypothetical protein